MPLWSSLKVTSRGSSTGRSEDGTGTVPQSLQWIIGMGVPQNRWRLSSQSFSLYSTVPWPAPADSSAAITASLAASPACPSNPSTPELTIGP